MRFKFNPIRFNNYGYSHSVNPELNRRRPCVVTCNLYTFNIYVSTVYSNKRTHDG